MVWQRGFYRCDYVKGLEVEIILDYLVNSKCPYREKQREICNRKEGHLTTEADSEKEDAKSLSLKMKKAPTSQSIQRPLEAPKARKWTFLEPLEGTSQHFDFSPLRLSLNF